MFRLIGDFNLWLGSTVWCTQLTPDLGGVPDEELPAMSPLCAILMSIMAGSQSESKTHDVALVLHLANLLSFLPQEQAFRLKLVTDRTGTKRATHALGQPFRRVPYVPFKNVVDYVPDRAFCFGAFRVRKGDPNFEPFISALYDLPMSEDPLGVDDAPPKSLLFMLADPDALNYPLWLRGYLGVDYPVELGGRRTYKRQGPSNAQICHPLQVYFEGCIRGRQTVALRKVLKQCDQSAAAEVDGATLLLQCAAYGFYEGIPMLLNFPSGRPLRDSHCALALCYAVFSLRHRPETLTALLKAPSILAAIDQEHPDDDAPALWFAGWLGHTDAATVLLAHGANPSTPDYKDETASAAAQEEGFIYLAALLADAEKEWSLKAAR